MQKFDIAIVGGGLAGVASAYFAARKGARVILFESRDLNLEASGSNAGSIHAQIPIDPFRNLGPAWADRFAATIPLFIKSIARWHDLERELDGSLGVSAKGGVMAAGTPDDLELLEQKIAVERAAGLQVDLWSQSELRNRAPFLADHLLGASFCSIEGKADPFRAVPLFAKRAQELGVEIRRNCKVTQIHGAQGAFSLTAGGTEYHAKSVINAAGAKAAEIAKMLGVALEIEGHPIQVAVTEKCPPLLPWLLYYTSDKLTIKQSLDGGFLIGGGWEASSHQQPRVAAGSMVRNLDLARQVMPVLGNLKIVRSWAATVNGTADWRPILGEAPGVPGFFLNLFPWLGFTAAPAVSEAIADMALGLTPQTDLSEFVMG